MVYDPRETPLALAWKRAGGEAIGGVRMLLHQAAEQVRLMTGTRRTDKGDGRGSCVASLTVTRFP